MKQKIAFYSQYSRAIGKISLKKLKWKFLNKYSGNPLALKKSTTMLTDRNRNLL
jgi:hypothetical protein